MQRYIRVHMADGSIWDIPRRNVLYLWILAMGQVGGELFEPSDLELIQWAQRHKRWSDVKAFAEQVQPSDTPESNWPYASKEMVTK